MAKTVRSTAEKFPITVTYGDKEYVGEVKPVGSDGREEKYEITFSGAFWGTIWCGGSDKWDADSDKNRELIPAIGSYIHEWYER